MQHLSLKINYPLYRKQNTKVFFRVNVLIQYLKLVIKSHSNISNVLLYIYYCNIPPCKNHIFLLKKMYYWCISSNSSKIIDVFVSKLSATYFHDFLKSVFCHKTFYLLIKLKYGRKNPKLLSTNISKKNCHFFMKHAFFMPFKLFLRRIQTQ